MCPELPNRDQGFVLAVYDENNVPTESRLDGQRNDEDDCSFERNRHHAWAPEDNNKLVERNFEPLFLPEDAPERIYAVVWQACSWQAVVGSGDS